LYDSKSFTNVVIVDISDIKSSYLEINGQVSFIKKKGKDWYDRYLLNFNDKKFIG
jgi:uncharacterized membrane protein YcaP (DUF421 family)